MASDPTDTVLAEFIASVLERVSPHFAEPEVVEEAIALHRDVWLQLYHLDRESPPDGG